MAQPTSYTLEVNPRIPRRLLRLEQLAGNLWYSWDRPTRALFARLHPALWDAVGPQPEGDAEAHRRAAADGGGGRSGVPGQLQPRAVGIRLLPRRADPAAEPGAVFAQGDLIAYFCAEFGFHESLPIYSGGLGILAGDHCKAASDVQLPFVAVGLLYRQGYFVQTIDGEGNQRAEYYDSDFDDLPITPVQREDGSRADRRRRRCPGARSRAKVWQARVGHVDALPARHRPAREQRARPRHRAPALRRRPHHAHRAGDRARRGRRARARGDRAYARRSGTSTRATPRS